MSLATTTTMAPPPGSYHKSGAPPQSDHYKRQMQMKTQYELRCSDCGTAEYLVEDGGSTKCTECGLIASQYVIDMGQEWHNYDDDGGDDKSRVGNVGDPLLGGDLSTDISNTKNAKHLMRGHMRNTKNDAERNLKEGFQKIEEMAGKLEILSSYTNTAKQLYKIMYELKPIKSSKDMIGYATASLYAACKIGGIARQLKEFMAVSTLDKKTIGKFYKKIETESKRVGQNGSAINEGMDLGYQSNTPAQMIPRFATGLKLDNKVRSAAERVAQKAVEFGITSGKAPTTVAAAAILMCSQLHTNKTPIKDIIEITGVTESTIRKCLKDLEANPEKLLPGGKL